MNHYLDIISRNHTLSEFTYTHTDELSSDNLKNLKNLKGGEQKNKKEIYKTMPTGSFPPIYKIKIDKKEKEKNNDKTRAFAQAKTSLSIKDIMESRRNDDTQSFISL